MNIPPVSSEEMYITAQGKLTARGLILFLAILAAIREMDEALFP